MNAPQPKVTHLATVMVDTPVGFQRRTYVIEAPSAREVDVDLLLNEGEVAVRVDVIPAVRLRFMPDAQRCRYTSEYATLLVFQISQRLGVQLEDVREWVHYDPIHVAAKVRAWVAGNPDQPQGV